ncbi:hypothetical protein [Sphingomonas sp.]|uniref:hypothetical protein n=1 Tax=Sphingomonas sp. TaxID=28214 RepID=UPI0031D1BF39
MLSVTSARSSATARNVLLASRCARSFPALLLDHRVDAVCDHLARGVAFDAGIGKADLGPYADRERLLLVEEATAETPVLGAVRHHQEEEGSLVAELVGFARGCALPIASAVRATVVSPSENGRIHDRKRPPKLVVCRRTRPNLVGRYLKKGFFPSHLRDADGRPWMGKMVPEEDSKTQLIELKSH